MKDLAAQIYGALAQVPAVDSDDFSSLNLFFFILYFLICFQVHAISSIQTTIFGIFTFKRRQSIRSQWDVASEQSSA